MLKIKDSVPIEELEKFGFKHRHGKCYEYIREIDGRIAYRIYTTKNNANIQIEILEPVIIAHRLQELLYDLIQAELVEKVSD